MNGFFLMNAPLIAILALVVLTIVTLGLGSEMFRRWLLHKERMAEALTTQTAEKAAQYAAHTERLEQRVRVLERIATDGGADLSHRIDALRDDRALN